jgi:N-acetylglucosamine-6-sulfatase
VALVLLLALAGVASARPVGTGSDGRPNILVVMTDDEAASDVAVMPNVRRLLAGQGTTFADAVDSFPLCCPARATFITGQYAHNHGVAGNFWPYGWYGMKDRANTLPRWLQKAGYTTALIGKWLNGYGARDAHGEVPKGFSIWRGLLDVSAYDYFNFVMNIDGHLRAWGDSDSRTSSSSSQTSRSPSRPEGFRRSSTSSRRSSDRRRTRTGAHRTRRTTRPT